MEGVYEAVVDRLAMLGYAAMFGFDKLKEAIAQLDQKKTE